MTRMTAAAGPRRWRDRAGHLLVTCLHDLLVGLYYMSPTFDLQVAQALAKRQHQLAGDQPEQPGGASTQVTLLAAPPPGHPETLATAVPLSAAEQELWTRLTTRRYRVRLAGRR